MRAFLLYCVVAVLPSSTPFVFNLTKSKPFVGGGLLVRVTTWNSARILTTKIKQGFREH